jgi:hypothetical protein
MAEKRYQPEITGTFKESTGDHLMKSKVSIVLLVILIFLLGGITGAVCHSLYQEYLKAAFFKASSQPIDIVGGLAKELNLDAQQVESLKVIFDQSRQRSIELSQKIWPQYQDIWKETEQQIKDMLRDDQRTRYEEFLKKFQTPPIPESPGNQP